MRWREEAEDEGLEGGAVSSLKRMLVEQREQFEEERRRLIGELEDSRQQISSFSKRKDGGRNMFTPSASLLGAGSVSSMGRRKFQWAEDEKENERNSMMVVGSGGRIEELEEALAATRTTIASLERTTEAAVRERNQALALLEKAELDTNLSKEEILSERSAKNTIRMEMERAMRASEAALREVRAADKRYEGVLLEMEEVMRGRDDAVQGKDEMARERDQAMVELSASRSRIAETESQRDAAIYSQQQIVQERDLLQRQLQSEQSQKLGALQNIELLQQQLNAAGLEKDSISRDRERAAVRLEEALLERRAALESRDAEQRRADDAAARVNELNALLDMSERKASHVQEQLLEIQTLYDNERQRAGKAQSELKEADRWVEAAGDDRRNAFQDLETAQRHIHGLTEELKAVIQTRDKVIQANAHGMSSSGLPTREFEGRSNDVRMLQLMRDLRRIFQLVSPNLPEETHSGDLISISQDLASRILAELTSPHLRTRQVPPPTARKPHESFESKDWRERLEKAERERYQLLSQIESLRSQLQNVVAGGSTIRESASKRRTATTTIDELELQRGLLYKEIESLQQRLNSATPLGSKEVQVQRERIRELSKANLELLQENERLKRLLAKEQQKLREALFLVRAKEEELSRFRSSKRTTPSTGYKKLSPSYRSAVVKVCFFFFSLISQRQLTRF
jgi:hypothetical protein